MDLRLKRDRTPVTCQNRVELLERSYTFPVAVGKLKGAVRKKLKWAWWRVGQGDQTSKLWAIYMYVAYVRT